MSSVQYLLKAQFQVCQKSVLSHFVQENKITNTKLRTLQEGHCTGSNTSLYSRLLSAYTNTHTMNNTKKGNKLSSIHPGCQHHFINPTFPAMRYDFPGKSMPPTHSISRARGAVGESYGRSRPPKGRLHAVHRQDGSMNNCAMKTQRLAPSVRPPTILLETTSQCQRNYCSKFVACRVT